MRRDTDPLLTAYVDGVTELTTEERARVEARLAQDPVARADEGATRELLGQLRDLAPEGGDPDWAAMERAIGEQVGTVEPQRWWRPVWRWLVPASALAMAGAMLLWLHAPPPSPAPPALPAVARHAVADAADDARVSDNLAETAEAVPLWLDGTEVDVALEAADLLGSAGPNDDELVDDGNVDGLLPTTDLAVVDELNAEQLARLESWLARKKS